MRPFQRAVLGVFVFICLSTFLGRAQETEQDLKCLECHNKVVEQAYTYVHQPFSEKKCSFCHVLPDEPSKDENHEQGLRSVDDIGINVCYSCHTKKNLGISHPVGVYPTREIRIPEELPKGSFGQILCLTCHTPHGSDEEYLGRKPVSAQLCIACHGERYYK